MFAQPLNKKAVEHYTYKDREKTHGFVLREVDYKVPLKDLEAELKKQNMPVTKVYNVQTKFKPLYLVITPVTYKIIDIKKKRIMWGTLITR